MGTLASRRRHPALISLIPAADAPAAGRAANSTFEDRAYVITGVERVLCRIGTIQDIREEKR